MSWLASFARMTSVDRMPLARLLGALAILASLTLLGALGYVWIEGMSFLDAFYMTVITLSTVGYGEVAPLSDVGRVYTITLILVGLGAALYAISALATSLIEGRLLQIMGRTRMKRAIAALHDHVIVCGFGRFGQAVSRNLRLAEATVVIVDPDPAAEAECREQGCYFIEDSALEDTVLLKAGIEKARALVAAIPSDSDNVFVTLSAREANPEVRIHARAESHAGARRLRLAGANQVISPHGLGGQRIANAIVRPGVVEFLELSSPGDGAEVDLEEIALAAESPLVDTPLSDFRERELRAAVVAIKRGDEPLRLNPGPSERLLAGDRVVVVGDHENLSRLAELASPSE
jgi:voltage-gated potassium channel